MLWQFKSSFYKLFHTLIITEMVWNIILISSWRKSIDIRSQKTEICKYRPGEKKHEIIFASCIISWLLYLVWLISPWTNGRHFQMHFHEWKVLYLYSISLKFVPKGPIDNKSVLIQVMVPRRQQAIIWTNADPIWWCIYAALARVGNSVPAWNVSLWLLWRVRCD